MKQGVVNIRGKEYQTVALRVSTFREKYPDYSLETEVLSRDDECVVMRATIRNPEGRVIATGHAEEYRRSSQINSTSALENAETSAIGRALAAFGLGGTEFASADEVANAIKQQNDPAARMVNASIAPAAGVLEKLDPDIQQTLQELAAETEEAFNKAGVTQAFGIFKDQEFDADEKVAFWSLLGSSCRSALKKFISEQRKAA